MRQILSTALVAVIVSLLTFTVAGAMAQTEPEQAPVEPAAGINADRVDGKHAIGFTNKKAVRRGKLVAANAAGELPSNIVRPFWGYIKNKPGILADHQISWEEVTNKPAGFADGVDAGDTTYSYIAGTSPTYAVGQNGFLEISYPATLDLEVSLVPANDGAIWATRDNDDAAGRGEEIFYRSGGTIYHYFYFKNYSGSSGELRARVTVFNDGVLAPAAAKRRVDVQFAKGHPAPRP